MNETSKCHIIQQAYLRNFACDEEKRKIWAFDKQLGIPPTEPISIKKIAVINHYYQQWLEEWINQQFEHKGIECVQEMIDRKSFEFLSDDHKRHVCDWLFIHFVRTPQFESYWFGSINKFFKRLISRQEIKIPQMILDQIKNPSFDIRNIPELQEKVKNNLWTYISNKNNNFFYEMLDTHLWNIVTNVTPYNYYTSDNPVVLFRNGKNTITFEGYIRFISNDKEMFIPEDRTLRPASDVDYFLPLTPKLLLSVANIGEFNSPGEVIAKRYVKTMNTMITVQSSNYVFSCENNFDDAIEANQTYPDSIEKENQILEPNIGEGIKSEFQLPPDFDQLTFNEVGDQLMDKAINITLQLIPENGDRETNQNDIRQYGLKFKQLLDFDEDKLLTILRQKLKKEEFRQVKLFFKRINQTDIHEDTKFFETVLPLIKTIDPNLLFKVLVILAQNKYRLLGKKRERINGIDEIF